LQLDILDISNLCATESALTHWRFINEIIVIIVCLFICSKEKQHAQ